MIFWEYQIILRISWKKIFKTVLMVLWGVYRFKRGFGGEIQRAASSWDRVYKPLLYRAYLKWTQRKNARLDS